MMNDPDVPSRNSVGRAETLTHDPAAAFAPKNLFSPGDVLNDTYEVLAMLGQGGMGQVWEAADRTLDRHVAIKAAWPHVQYTPLRDEARALAAVRHPCLPAVYCMGKHGAVSYIVMERIYGVPLDAVIDQYRTPGANIEIARAVGILHALSSALEAVHEAGLAHRDVKPENVMIAPGARVVLMDFGIARPEVHIVPSDMAGSPAYMAPEMIKLQTRPAEGRLLDLYALGIIGFELLTGQLPFAGNTPMSQWVHHLKDPIPDVRAVRPDVPARLAALLEDLMAKEPEGRPQTAQEVRWRLEAVRDHSESEPPTGPLRVLVVDDDPEFRHGFISLLRHATPSATVRTASDGQGAIDAVRRQMPDVMFLDVEMPRMNGIEVCMYLRSMHLAEHCMIIPISGTLRDEDRRLLRSLGAAEVLDKDVNAFDRVPEILAHAARLRSASTQANVDQVNRS